MKSAICVLTRGYDKLSNYNKLITRNICVYEKIYKHQPEMYDILIFHEGNILEEHQAFIQKRTSKLPIKFINIANEFNNNFKKGNSIYSQPEKQSIDWYDGYKFMNRFWFAEFLKYTNDYKYLIRVDEDCFIQQIDKDIISKIEEKNINYYTGFVNKNYSDGIFHEGLYNLTIDFSKKNNIMNNFTIYNIPYCNISIMNVEYFRNNILLTNYCKEIENEGGIFFRRWDSKILWGAFLGLSNIMNTSFWEDDKLKYYHGSHDKYIN